jgi:small subunit ribosomal protein S16
VNKSFACGHGTPDDEFRCWRIFNKKKEIEMAVVIRLQRHGGKKNPYYHIVAVDSRAARDSGNVLERLGKYDPMQPKDSDRRVAFDADKIKSWMAKGARPSDRVYKFLANAGMLPKKEHPVQTKKNQPSEKTLAKLKAREEKLAKAAEAAAPAPEALASETPASETPVSETPAAEAPAPETSAPETPAEQPAAAPAETPESAPEAPVSETPVSETPKEPAAE